MENENQRITQLKNMLSEDEKDCFLLFALAKEYEKEEDLDQALRFYDEIVKINPQYVGVYYHFARLLIEISEEEQAISMFNQGIDIAKQLEDHHALSELKSAKLNFELGL